MTATIERTIATLAAPVPDGVLPASTFDYSQMDEARAATIQALVPEIQRAARHSATGAIEVGRRLNQAKGLLPHGAWGDWLEKEFTLSTRSATRYMKLAKEFGENGQLADLTFPAIQALPATLATGYGGDAEKPADDNSAIVKAARRVVKVLVDQYATDVSTAFAGMDANELGDIERAAHELMEGAKQARERLEDTTAEDAAD